MITQSSCTSWNGPICAYCNRGYIGAHQCSADDLMARIALLQRVMVRQADFSPAQPSYDVCPCSPSRGGSGICGCVLNSGVTC